MKYSFLIGGLFWLKIIVAQSYAPAAGQVGSTAIHADSAIIHSWITTCEVTRGLQNITNTTGPLANAGTESMAIGKADGACVSLGDGGVAIITLDEPLSNEPGFDFAVFENGFFDGTRNGFFLELATVAVSSNGVDYVTYPSHSEISDTFQLGSFEVIDPRYITGFAGKYEMRYGTPFDLGKVDSTLVDIHHITHIKITDVVGNIDPLYATYDSKGNAVNDPWPTAFPVGGFDLDAIAILKEWLVNGVTRPNTQNVAIYPNPVVHTLRFSPVQKVTIYSMQGNILVEKNNVSSVDVSSFNSGIYIVRVEANKKVFIKQIVKQ